LPDGSKFPDHPQTRLPRLVTCQSR